MEAPIYRNGRSVFVTAEFANNPEYDFANSREAIRIAAQVIYDCELEWIEPSAPDGPWELRPRSP